MSIQVTGPGAVLALTRHKLTERPRMRSRRGRFIMARAGHEAGLCVWPPSYRQMT